VFVNYRIAIGLGSVPQARVIIVTAPTRSARNNGLGGGSEAA
jgi:hypothetical protein